MATSPILGLTLMSASQAQKEVVFNNFLIAMDSLFKLSVISMSLTTPPGSPSEGDAYVVGASATGAWSGQDHNIAFYYNGWQFVTSPLKLKLYNQATSGFWTFQGAGGGYWTADATSTVSALNDLNNVTGSPTDGMVLTWVNGASQWEPMAPLTVTAINAQTANYTFVLGDAGALVQMNSSSARTMTVPPNSSVAFPIRTQIKLEATGTGAVSVVAGAGVTINASGGVLTIPAQYGTAMLVKTATNVWTLTNDGYATVRLDQLTDVNVTEGAGIDGKVLYWDDGAGAWKAKTIDLLTLPDVDTTGLTDAYVMSYHAASSKVRFVALSSITSIASLSDVGDVQYPGGGAGAISFGEALLWNGSKWAPSSSVMNYKFEDLTDGPGLLTGHGLSFIRVDVSETQLDYVTAAQVASQINASLSFANMGDVVISGTALGQTLTWNGTGWQNANKVDIPCGSLTGHSGAVSLNRVNGEVQRLQLTGNVTLAVTNWPAAGQLGRLVLEVQNTGAYNITAWPSGTIWSGGSAPTITSGSGKKDIIVLMTFDGGTTIYGSAAGQDYS